MTSLTPQARALLDGGLLGGGDDGPSPAARARMRRSIAAQIAAAGTVAATGAVTAQSAAATATATAAAAAAGAGAGAGAAANTTAAATGAAAATFGGVTASKLLLGATLVGALGVVGVWRTIAPGDNGVVAATTTTTAAAPEAIAAPNAVAPAKAAANTIPAAEAQPPAHAASEHASPAHPTTDHDEPTTAAVAAAAAVATALPPTSQPLPTTAPSAGSAAGASASAAAASLDEQTALLMRARRAVREGRHAQALALLADYSRRYGDGALAEERSALQVMALCRHGRPGAANEADVEAGLKAAEQFRLRFPHSPLRSHVEQACRKP